MFVRNKKDEFSKPTPTNRISKDLENVFIECGYLNVYVRILQKMKNNSQKKKKHEICIHDICKSMCKVRFETGKK